MTVTDKPKKSAPKTNGEGKPLESARGDKVMHSYLIGNTFGAKKVEYAAIDGLAVFEGDIILGTVQEMEQIRQQIEQPDPTVEGAVALPDLQARWPNAIIPFTIDQNMPDQQRVTDAINHIQANTNLRLRTATTEPNFVKFQGGSGCSSSVGMRGNQQVIMLGPGCDWPRAVHEICHAAGLWHEQSREDRDNFVTINWSNIQLD